MHGQPLYNRRPCTSRRRVQGGSQGTTLSASDLHNTRATILNSLAPGRFQRNFRKVIFQLILVIDGWSISCKILLKWMPMDLTDGKSTLVQVKAWCHQATSHYLSQSWPRSLPPYGVIRPQCNIKRLRQNKTWTEADIPCINLTPNRYNALAPAIVYVSNDVTIPFSSMTSQ